MRIAIRVVAAAAALSISQYLWAYAGTSNGYVRFTQASDTIRIDGNTVFTGLDYTYEMVVRVQEGSPAGQVISEQRDSFEDKTIRLSGATFEGGMVRGHNCGGVNQTVFPVSIAGRWIHLAWVRTGSTARLYIDGQIHETWENLASCTGNHAGSWMSLGMFIYGAGWFPGATSPSFRGDLDWIRISDVARYSGPFTPPCEASIASDSHTELLLRFNEGPGTTTLVDESPNGFVCQPGVAVTTGYQATSPQFVLADGTTNFPCADCNGDGIPDSEQVARGELADYNGNNIPDCCESGTPCAVGNYPVQWRVEDGGNGHWYQLDVVPRSWPDAQSVAAGRGGHLATIASSDENSKVTDWSILRGVDRPWLGGFQDLTAPDYSEPAGGWRWVTGELWQFSAWCPGEPNNFPNEHYLHIGNPASECWNDVPEFGVWGVGLLGAVVEWSADCNGDGIVDYGQILSGQLTDANGNGVPDICEFHPCPADLTRNGVVNGVDLAAVLSSWGTDGQSEFGADINGDGIVDGLDLTIVLGGWGPCP